MWYNGRILLSGLRTCSWVRGRGSGLWRRDWNEKFPSHNCLWAKGLFFTPFILCVASSSSQQSGMTQTPRPPVIKQVDIRANTSLCGTYMSLRSRSLSSIYFDSISQEGVIIYWLHGSKTPLCWKNVKMSIQTLIAEMGMGFPWDAMLLRSA